MLGYAKGTDARKYKGQGKARERQRHSINENEKTHSLTRSHEKGRKRDHTPNREKAPSRITMASASADLTYKPHKKEKKKKSLVEPNKSWKIGLSLSRS